ncbi:glycerate 2-kinase [Enterococcus sp. AZ007]
MIQLPRFFIDKGEKMKIISAIDSMKGSLTSKEANQIIKNTFEDEKISVEPIAIADGGEGTVEAFVSSRNGQIKSALCHDLKGAEIDAQYGWLADEKTVIIESAQTCGIQFLDGTISSHPRKTSSFGLGEQLITACKQGARRVIVGLGGTGTIDCGIGMLAGLGVEFFDNEEQPVSPIPENFQQIARISTDHLPNELNELEIIIASDVQSVITGETGAVYMFGEQKGLRADELVEFERDIHKFSQLLLANSESQPGDGAAGGIALALRTIFDAQIVSGIDLLIQYTDLEKRIKQSDLVITGEGRMDAQSLQGKVPVGIAKLAKQHGVPVIAFVGEVSGEPLEFEKVGLSVIIPIVAQLSTLKEALANAKQNLELASMRAKQLLFLLQKNKEE